MPFGLSLPAWATIIGALAVLMKAAHNYGKKQQRNESTHSDLEDDISEIKETLQELQADIRAERRERQAEHEVVVTWLHRIDTALSDEIDGNIQKPDEVQKVIRTDESSDD